MIVNVLTAGTSENMTSICIANNVPSQPLTLIDSAEIASTNSRTSVPIQPKSIHGFRFMPNGWYISVITAKKILKFQARNTMLTALEHRLLFAW